VETKDNIQIAVVDDNDQVLQSLFYVLIKEGFSVIDFNSGSSVLEQYKSKEFRQNTSVIVLDIDMPKVTGTDVIKAIKSSGEYRLVPQIVVYSALDTRELRRECAQCGADSFIIKTSPIDDLIDAIISNANIWKKFNHKPKFTKKELVNIENTEIYIDKFGEEVFYKNQNLNLSRTEYKIFVILLENLGTKYLYNEIGEIVYNWDDEAVTPRVRTHLSRLKTKVRDSFPDFPFIIKNFYGGQVTLIKRTLENNTKGESELDQIY
jgi:DNA-binding response OmpR family regulator